MTRLKILNWFKGLTDKERSNFIIKAYNLIFDDNLIEQYMKYDYPFDK